MNTMQEQFDPSSIPFDFNPLHTLDGNQNANLYAGDDKLHITFKTEAVMNPSASTKAGRPIYDDIDMVVIRTPGSQLTSIVAPIKHYMDRFGSRYRVWKETQMQAQSGTPLDNFPFLFNKPSLIAELKYRNIFTVEQLAELSDSGKQSIMGGHELCKKAAEWISKTASDADDAEKEEMRKKMAAMEAQLAALASASDMSPKTRAKRQSAKSPATEPSPAPVESLPLFMDPTPEE
jgi:hypothetical protein